MVRILRHFKEDKERTDLHAQNPLNLRKLSFTIGPIHINIEKI